jgi:glycosyltransferase involved in cell wall biosynthesis
VLHTHNAAPHLVGAPAARLARVPVVVHTRHGRHLHHARKTKLAARFATWQTDRVVAVSADAAEVARSVDHAPDSRLQIIRNGIDLERFPARSDSGGRPIRRAVHVARLDDSIKDQTSLLRAIRIVADSEPGFALDIVGDGPSRHDLETLCDELDLRCHVRFLGYRHDVRDLLNVADLFILSSVTEGLSISILEAMASGLPVVATNVGGNPEIVLDQKTGILVPIRNPPSLARGILRLMAHPARAEEMGRAGRRRVEEEFDLRHAAAQYEELYERLLSE